jgi:hypothetical protein
VPHCARHTSSYGTGGSLSATPATWQRGLALAMARELCEPALSSPATQMMKMMTGSESSDWIMNHDLDS